MKKIITVLFAALLLTACGSKTEEPQKLVMATEGTFEPYEFYDGDEIVGIDVEIAKAIADELNVELEIVDIAFDSIIAGVMGGKYDIGMAGITVTEERKEQVNFSNSYATGVQVVIVNEDSEITCVDDLFGDKNYVVGTQAGTTGFLYATWDIEDEGLGTVNSYQKTTDAASALLDGKIDCILLDNEPAKAIVTKNPSLKILESEYAVEEYAIAINKEQTELVDKINAALDKLKADGTIDTIVNKYIGD